MKKNEVLRKVGVKVVRGKNIEGVNWPNSSVAGWGWVLLDDLAEIANMEPDELMRHYMPLSNSFQGWFFYMFKK